MRNIIRNALSITVLAAFVLLNWATSQEEDFRELNAEAVIFQDTLIILKNLDNLSIADAELSLVAPESESFKQYRINEYALSSLSSDTLQMVDFMDENNIAYLDSIRPSSFYLSMYLSGNTGNTIVNFTTDL